MIKKLILCMLLFVGAISIVAAKNSWGLTSGTTTTGVYYEAVVKDNERILSIMPFNGFSLSTTWGTITGHAGEYVCNSSGSSSASDGWVSTSGYSRGKVTCQIEILSVASGTASVRIVGRLGDIGTGSVLYEHKKSEPNSISFPVSEAMDWYRFEYNIDTIGTDSVRARLKITDSVR